MKKIFLLVLMLAVASFAARTVRYVNTASTAGGDGTTNGTEGSTRAYPLLKTACAAFNGTTLSDTLEIICSGSAEDTGHVVLNATTASNKIVYIHPGTSDWHAGVWDASKYHMVITGGEKSLDIQSNNVKLEGLQIQSAGTLSDWGGTIFFSNQAWETCIVARCLISLKSDATGNYFSGIKCMSSDQAIICYNNIVYDFNKASTGYGVFDYYGGRKRSLYYNNTITGCYDGMRIGTGGGSSNYVLVNNLINVTDQAVFGACSTSGSNSTNKSSLGYTVYGTAKGSDRTSQTFTFANSAGKDFHLSSGDAGAKGYGYDLSSDTYFPISTDIDGQTRVAPWDIGADQSCVKPSSASYNGGNTIYDTTGQAVSHDITYTGSADSITAPNGLPAGLSITKTGANIGRISGTPTTVQSATSYKVKLWSSCGNDSCTVGIAVSIGRPGPLSYSSSPIIMLINNAYSQTITNSGGAADSFTISPAPPTGLSFSKTTGTISGTPTVAASKAGYKVKSYNSAGSDSCFDTITVVQPTNYYVSYSDGNNSNNGLSAGAPWKDFSKVNTVTFYQGDSLLLKRGDTWSGDSLWPKGSGAAGAPIVLGAYGSGNRPKIDGQGAHKNAVMIKNQSYWIIQDLEVLNNNGMYHDNTYPKDGIAAEATTGLSKNITIQRCYVHHAYGKDENNFPADDDHTYGGIAVHSEYTADSTARFDSVLIRDCRVDSCGRMGITAWDHYHEHESGTHGSTNIRIIKDTVTWSKGDGILTFGCDYVLIDSCKVGYSGWDPWGFYMIAACWTTRGKSHIVQRNEVYNSFHPGGDGEAFDADYDLDSVWIQYNYSHDNAGGFLLAMEPSMGVGPQNVWVRYNISVNDGRVSSNGVFNIRGSNNLNIYNNTIYSPDTSHTALIKLPNGSTALTGTTFKNNIFALMGSSHASNDAISNGTFDYNSYWGQRLTNEPTEAHKITANPLFKDTTIIVVPQSDWSNLQGAKLLGASTLIAAGTAITNNGTYDFFGQTIRSGAPTLGFSDYPSGPTITVHPQNTSLCTGGTASFTVTASGSGTVHYQWKRNGSNVGSDQNSYSYTVGLSNNNDQVLVVTTDDNGSTTSNTATVSVTQAPAFTYATNPASYTLGVAITSNTVSSTGGAIDSFTGTVAAGLSLNKTTGAITGTPTTEATATTYTITAHNCSGTATVNLQITVSCGSFGAISYASNPATATQGTAHSNAFSLASGSIDSVTLASALPAGLSLAKTGGSMGNITGTPTTETASNGYKIYAWKCGAKKDSLTLTLTVNPSKPGPLSYAASPATCSLKVRSVSYPITNGGGRVDSFTISPELPSRVGLSFGKTTGTISGLPLDSLVQTDFKVKGYNVTGVDSCTFRLTVSKVLWVTHAGGKSILGYHFKTPICTLTTTSKAITFAGVTDTALATDSILKPGLYRLRNSLGEVTTFTISNQTNQRQGAYRVPAYRAASYRNDGYKRGAYR